MHRSIELCSGKPGPSVWGAVLLWIALAIPTAAQVQFTDVRVEAGLGSNFYDSTTLHSLGINWLDYDNDGWVDLFAVAGGPGRPPHLFRNLGDGSFQQVDDLLPSLPTVEMSGSVFADFDRDGDVDLFVYTDNPEFRTTTPNLPDGPANLLLINQWMENGGGLPADGPLFIEGAEAVGLEDLVEPPFGDLPCYRSKTAGWVDFDRDGCIDLYVGHMVMNAGGSMANRDSLYRNRCDGTFEDVTERVGLAAGSDPSKLRGSLAFVAAHLDDDLWPDLYVVHAAGGDMQPYINDFLYKNRGDGTFEEILDSMDGPGDDTQAGMGIDVADFDLDGDWDIYISDLLDTTRDELPLGNALYLGQGDGTFSDNVAPTARVEGHNSWGVAFFDMENDGDEDLHVATTTTADQELLYRNNGNGTFTNIALFVGIETDNSRGSAVADYDQDGDLDLAVVNQRGFLQLLRNDTPNAGRWLQLRLRGTESNLDAIGAVVKLRAGDRQMMRQIIGGSSAHSQHDLTVHFGLANARWADTVEIYWPSGGVTRWTSLAADQIVEVEEGSLFRNGFESGMLDGWNDAVSGQEP